MSFEQWIRESMALGFEDGRPLNIVQVSEKVMNTPFIRSINNHDEHLNKALNYFRENFQSLPPQDQAMHHVISVVFHTGIFGARQLEHGLYQSEMFGLDFDHALQLRAYLEIVARCHKAIRLIKVFQSNRDEEQFAFGGERIIKKFIPSSLDSELRNIYEEYRRNQNGEALVLQINEMIEQEKNSKRPISGYNVMTLVQSLRDKIPDIDEQYDQLSEYLHGDFTSHYMAARSKMLLGPVAAVPLFKSRRVLHEQLEAVVLGDLDYLYPFAQHYIERT